MIAVFFLKTEAAILHKYVCIIIIIIIWTTFSLAWTGHRSPNCSSSYCYNIDGSWQGNYKSKLKVFFLGCVFNFPSRCAYFILWIYISTNENWNHGSGGFSMKYRENVTSIQTLYLGEILHNTKSKGNNSLYPR